MSKKFGQNFLISKPSLEKIASFCPSFEGKRVWEVGPGIGALTSVFLRGGALVTAFEIDHGFAKILREKAFPQEKNFSLIEGDALKTWKTEFEENRAPDFICANLPYNVGSVFIASLIENRCLPRIMVYTLQSEVVSRICAKPQSSDWSGFSILTSIDYANSEALKLKAGCFFPSPNVDSSVVVMKRRDVALVPEALVPRFLSLVRILFSQKRKTVRNNLKTAGLDSDSLLATAGIDPMFRAEALSVQQIAQLAAVLK